MAERGERKADRANEYLKRGGTERIRRLRERAQQMGDYLWARQARRRLRPSCEGARQFSEVEERQ